jgi:heptosyltransferase-2
MIWNLPFIHAIAAQTGSGRITLLTKRRSKADLLLASDPHIADILWLERGGGEHDGIGGSWRLAADLRRQQFRIVWILHHSVRYALLSRLAGIPQRIGYGTFAQRWWLSRGAYLPAGAVPHHPIDAGSQLLRHMNIAIDSTQPHLPLDQIRRLKVQRHWQPLTEGVNIVLGIGSSEDFKIWPAEHFAELIRKIHLQHGRVKFFLFGCGDKEQVIAGRIEQQTRPAAIDVVNALNIPIDEAVHLLSLADLYIGNDTGFLNVAVALQVPAVGIFGASPPLRYTTMIYPVLPPAGALNDYDRSGAGIRSICVDAVYRAAAGQFPQLVAGA